LKKNSSRRMRMGLDEKLDLAFQRFLKRKLGLCYSCKHAIFLGDGWGVWCRARKRMYYARVKKCQYYEKEAGVDG